MKYAFMIVCVALLTGCGAADRFVSSVTGDGIETCVDGVAYLQFTSGASVKYNRDGSVATCLIKG